MLHWLRQLSEQLHKSGRPTPRRRLPIRFRPSLESLEDRTVPAGLMTVRIGGGDLLPMVLDDANLPNLANLVRPVLPQATFALDPGSDTGVLGDLRTTLGFVNLVGRTGAGFRVQALAGGNAATADALGNFTLTNVPLGPGLNNVLVQVTSTFGYIGQSGSFFTRNTAPVVNQTIANVTVAQDAADTIINLNSTFRDDDAFLLNSIVRYDTVLGSFEVQLFDTIAPLNVANFLRRVNDGNYRDSIFHRRELDVPEVLQGGGFRVGPDGLLPPAIPAGSTVRDEVGLPNIRGTIAMAKTNAPNSATSQYFFNLVDNTDVLSPQAQANGGFTVFGEVIGNGMQVVDNLADLTVTIGPSPFNEIPLINFPADGAFPADAVRANYAIVNDIVLQQRRDGMTFQVVGNSNPALVNVTVSGSSLTLDYQPNQTGTAVITIQATDRDGLTTLTTFGVTVN